MAHRSTPNKTTGVSPSKMLFRRETRTKLPSVEQFRPDYREIRYRDNERKQQGKDYADRNRHAKESDLILGNKFC